MSYKIYPNSIKKSHSDNLFNYILKVCNFYKPNNFKSIENYPNRWGIELLMKEKPDFLAYRKKILWDSSEDQKWFDENYKTLRIFEYNPEDFTSIPFLQWILKHGDHANYHVLKLRE